MTSDYSFNHFKYIYMHATALLQHGISLISEMSTKPQPPPILSTWSSRSRTESVLYTFLKRVEDESECLAALPPLPSRQQIII